MGTKSCLAGAAILVLIADPSAAQNAHHYQGGPKTVVPHAMTHPGSEASITKKVTKKKLAKRNAGNRTLTPDLQDSTPSGRPMNGHTGHHPGH